MTIDPDEAVRIVEALAAGEISPDRAFKAALATVKPKWPLVLKATEHEQFIVSQPDDMGTRCFTLKTTHGDPPIVKMVMVDISEQGMDYFVVEHLKHRGVDVERVVADLRFHEEAHDLDNSLSAALQSILDNAEASE